MTVRSLLLSMALGVVTFASAAAPRVGATFSAPDNRISVWLPAQPKVSTNNLPSQTGAPYRRTLYAVAMPHGTLLACIFDFRGDLPATGDERSFLDTMLQNLTRGFGADFQLAPVGQKDLTLAGSDLPGREIVGTVQGMRFVLRAYMGRNSIYTLEAGSGPQDAETMATVDRFMSSLVVNRD